MITAFCVVLLVTGLVGCLVEPVHVHVCLCMYLVVLWTIKLVCACVCMCVCVFPFCLWDIGRHGNWLYFMRMYGK